jgi:hypothetical protein
MQLSSFTDEVVKIAEETGGGWAVPAGVLGGATLAAGGLAAARPALRAHVLADLKSLGRGGAHAVDRAKGLPQAVLDNAKQVGEHLRSKGLDPAQARIAISGTGGTGKSSLARGLGEHLGMKPMFLDDAGKSLKGRDLTKYVRDNPIGPGTIAEQTHLLTQVDPSKFDAIIHIEKPMRNVKKQILERGRGAGQLDLYDYDKLHKTIQTAFKTTAGEAATPVPGVHVKMRPDGGFKAEQALGGRLRQKGKDPSGMSREKQVITAAGGSTPMLGGVLPYVKKQNIVAAGGIVGGGGAAGGLAAQRLRRSGDDV